MNDIERANALPFLSEAKAESGPIKENSLEDTGFLSILKIFSRTWPFILPFIKGYWYEFGSRSEASQYSGTDSSGSSWKISHVPSIVTFFAILGPTAGLIDPQGSWLHMFVVASAIFSASLTWFLLFAEKRLFLILSLGLAFVSANGFLFALFFLDGYLDNLYAGLVLASALLIWTFQYRLIDGRFAFRVRLGSHLVYYFTLLWASTLLVLLISLFSVDVISQSILQAKPLTTFVADFVGQPELAASNSVEGSSNSANVELQQLSDEQRHSLKWVYAVFLVIGWLAQIPAALILPYYYIFIMQGVNQGLRLALLQRWHRLSLRYHSSHRVGDSVYRIYQDSAQVTAVVGEITQGLQVIITYFTGVLFLFALDPLLGSMATTIVVLAIIWGRWFSPRMRERSLNARILNSDFTSRVQETFSSLKIIKAFGAEKEEQSKFERDSVTAFNASYRVRSLMAIVGIVTFTIAAAALLYGQYITAIWAQGERETFATVLVGLVGLSFLKWNLSAYQSAQEQLGAASVSVRDLIDRWTRAQDMAMGLNRVFDILDIEPDVKNRDNAEPLEGLRNDISFENVSFSYEQERPVLKNISFSTKRGDITAIVGPTGSGKSSMMGLMSRLFDPDSGQIKIDGVDLRDIELSSLRNSVSIALQENVLFGMSVRDNIRYVVPSANDEAVMSAASVSCIDEYIDSLPEGLDTMLSDRGGKLSTGQKQRLSIARAILKDSPILILDEPTAALDAQTEHRVMENLSAWGKDRAIFLITHRISTIRKANQILYLDDGKLIERGTHDELLKLDNGRYRKFVETEARLSERTQAE